MCDSVFLKLTEGNCRVLKYRKTYSWVCNLRIDFIINKRKIMSLDFLFRKVTLLKE